MKRKTLGGFAFIALGACSMALATIGVKGINNSTRLEAGAYNLTLNNGNGTSGTNVTETRGIVTDSGSYTVAFSYTNCSSLNNGHATILAGGKIVNHDHIRSIYSLTAIFTTSGTLKFRTSYDGATWGGYTNMISTQPYEFGSQPYYVEFSTDGTHSVDLKSAVFSYTCLVNENANEDGSSAGDEYVFEKVTSSSSDWSGEYMVVWEQSATSGRAFKGSYSNNAYETVTINNGVINAVPNTTVELVKSGGNYNAKILGSTNSGKYIYGSEDSNYLNIGSSASGSISVKQSSAGYGLYWNDTYALRMNDGSNGYDATWAYKFYKSSSSLNSEQSLCKLYRKVYLPEYQTPVDENGFVATDSGTYTTSSIFDNDNGLNVQATFTDGSNQQLSKGANGYSYVVTNSINEVINTSAAFGEAGNYSVAVSYKNYLPVIIPITVGRNNVLTSATIHMNKTTFNTADKLSTYLSNIFTFDVTYNYSDLNASGLAYSELSSHGLTLSVYNKSTGLAINYNNAFGTEGTYTVKITNGTVTASQDITVDAIMVTDITLDNSSLSLVKGKTAQLTATVTPNNATNNGVLWTSSDNSVATVSSSGLVTAVDEGTCTITASAKDESGVYGTCTIIVSASQEHDVWTLVTDASNLEAGDEIVIANYAQGVVAGDISSQVMASVDSTFSADHKNITSLSDDAVKLTLGGTSGAWTLSNSDDELLGATAVKKLAWDSGTTTWSISIVSEDATIQNGTSTYGRFLYNVNTPRFSTYTSATSSSMLLPQIYVGSTSTPIYPTDITLGGIPNNTLGVNETGQLTVSYTPATVNQKVLTFASSDESVATISNDGLITALAVGSTTITVTAKKNAQGDVITKTFTLSVVTIPVTGVSLNKNSTSIGVGQTETLTATVLPNNATNKGVSWSSSNTGIASVNNGVVTANAVGTARITVTTTNGGYTAHCDVTVTEEQIDKWTIMIYLCGSDLESGHVSETGGGYANRDIKEILSVNNQPDDVNIIIETGGSTAWTSGNKGYDISSTSLGRYHVRNKQLINDATLTNAAMGDSNTFQSFLEWGLTFYPAQKTGVILWNHGGAMRGVCYDETEIGGDDPLLNSEVTEAVSKAFTNTGRTEKLEWIGYDACLMQVQDIAEFNSQYFNYMVGSEESEAGEGWDYDTWLDDLYADKSTETILTAICDGFIQSYEDTYGAYYDNDQTLSFLDLAYMPAYKQAFESMADSMYSKISSYGKTNFQNLMKTVKEYGTTVYTYSDLQDIAQENGVSVSYVISYFDLEQVGNYYYDYGYKYFGIFDVNDFLNKVSAVSSFNSLSTNITSVNNAFNNLVVHSAAGDEAGESYGLVLFFPLSSDCAKGTYYSNSETHFTKWKSIVDNFGK